MADAKIKSALRESNWNVDTAVANLKTEATAASGSTSFTGTRTEEQILARDGVRPNLHNIANIIVMQTISVIYQALLILFIFVFCVHVS